MVPALRWVNTYKKKQPYRKKLLVFGNLKSLLGINICDHIRVFHRELNSINKYLMKRVKDATTSLSVDALIEERDEIEGKTEDVLTLSLLLVCNRCD